jgi:hypothetical protein
MGEGANWLLKPTAKLIDKSTSPRVTERWFTGQYGRMAALATLSAIPMLIFAALQGVVRSDARIVARAWFVHAPLAFVFTGIALVVVDQLLSVSDGMSQWISQATAGDAQRFLTSVSKVFLVGNAVPTTHGIASFVMVIGALIAVLGAFVVWLELVLREAGIYIVLAFLPICLMGMIWPRAAHWAKAHGRAAGRAHLRQVRDRRHPVSRRRRPRERRAPRRLRRRAGWGRRGAVGGVLAVGADEAHPGRGGGGGRRGWAAPGRSHGRDARAHPRAGDGGLAAAWPWLGGFGRSWRCRRVGFCRRAGDGGRRRGGHGGRCWRGDEAGE